MVSTIDPALVKICDEIAARGGPTKLPGVPSGVLVPAAAPATVRVSARLRGFQPEVDALKNSDGGARRTRRSSEGLFPGKISVGDPYVCNIPAVVYLLWLCSCVYTSS